MHYTASCKSNISTISKHPTYNNLAILHITNIFVTQDTLIQNCLRRFFEFVRILWKDIERYSSSASVAYIVGWSSFNVKYIQIQICVATSPTSHRVKTRSSLCEMIEDVDQKTFPKATLIKQPTNNWEFLYTP